MLKLALFESAASSAISRSAAGAFISEQYFLANAAQRLSVNGSDVANLNSGVLGARSCIQTSK